MFLEIHTDRRRKHAYSYPSAPGFRETFRENGQVRHRTRGRVTGLGREQLLTLRDFIRSGCPGSGEASCEVSDSREWGASHAILTTARALGLPKLLYSRSEPWVRYALAMIVGRVVYQGSKLALTNLWKDTALWSLCGLTHPQMWELIHRKVIEPSLFDERNIAEITEPNDPSIRYLLCRPGAPGLTAEKERKTRLALIEKTREALEKLTRPGAPGQEADSRTNRGGRGSGPGALEGRQVLRLARRRREARMES